jgi:uncharacterized membrane protein
VFVSGIAFGLALWTLFIAVKEGEATHIVPFNGAMVSVFVYVLASYFLNEALTLSQQIGILILICASIVLSIEKSHDHKGFHIGFLWAIISGLLFAISHVSAKYLYELYPFWTGFIWTRGATGIVGLVLLLSPSVWASFKRKKKENKTYARKHSVGIMVSNKVLGVLAVVLIQYASAYGSVTIVNALAGVQYIFIFLLMYLLTKFFPKVLREYFTKQEIVIELVAISMVIVGSVLFVF